LISFCRGDSQSLPLYCKAADATSLVFINDLVISSRGNRVKPKVAASKTAGATKGHDAWQNVNCGEPQADSSVVRPFADKTTHSGAAPIRRVVLADLSIFVTELSVAMSIE
jgi:hypothetical protein